MSSKRRIITAVIAMTLIVILAAFALSIIKTGSFNRAVHTRNMTGAEVFLDANDESQDVSFRIVPRGSTWSKMIDPDNKGLTEHNYQAFTYDLFIENNTNDELSGFTYTFKFDREVYLWSAWNGGLEIHQIRSDGEHVNTVPDLREYNAGDYTLDIFTVDGDGLVRMMPGDFFVYQPGSDETPVKPQEGVTPGIIVYIPINEDISGSTLRTRCSSGWRSSPSSSGSLPS